MQLRNFVIAGVATLVAAGTLALTAAPSQAVAIANFATSPTPGSPATLVTFGGGNGGVFAGQAGGMLGTTTSTAGPSAPSSIVFTSFSAFAGPNSDGSSQQNFQVTGGGTGTFTINSASGILLQGTYNSALANTVAGRNSVTLNSGLVTYTQGSYLALVGLTPGATGSFGFSLSGVNPATGFTGGFLNGFTLPASNGTFAATFEGVNGGVPEPSEWAVIGMASLTLGGLMVRARRKGGLGMTAA